MKKNNKFHNTETAAALAPAIGIGIFVSNFTVSLGTIGVYLTTCVTVAMFALTNWLVASSRHDKAKPDAG